MGLLLLDRDFAILRLGAGLAGLLGYREEEVVGKPFTALVHPDDRVSASLSMRSLTGDDGQMRTVERRYQHKDGTAIWILGSVARLSANPGAGEPAYVAQITPIDKQKHAEAATEEALERWTFALENAGQGVWDYDLRNSQYYFSHTWKRMRGIPENEVLISDEAAWLALVHPDDRMRVREIVGREQSGELTEIAYEYREKHRDGRWLWIMARGRCIEWSPDGKPLRIIGTDTDITEIKQRELDYAYLSQRLNLALTTSRVGVWIADRETKETVWDRRAAEIFGFDDVPSPIPAGLWESLIHPDDRERVLDMAARCFADGSECDCEYRIITPARELRHLRTRSRIGKDAEGRDKMICIVFDVTSDIEHAEALELANRLAEKRNVELEAARAAMEHASLHDGLTGLPNRRYLDAMLGRIADPSGACSGVTILHLDLDRFKQINDTKGHAAGDALLVHMASILRAIVGSENTVARIGGDEFVVVLKPGPSRPRLNAVLDEILARTHVPIFWEGHECRTSASIGVAEADGMVDARQLLINADIALYRAKNLGRNRAAFFNAQLQAEIIASKQCGDDILRGLDRREFVPLYQPQFDADTLEVIGVEALARWNHPEHGMLSPARFLSVAQEFNAIPAIDHVILKTALADLARWDAAGISVPKTSVNVSARRLADERLIDKLQSLRWTPGRLAFELLESIFLDETDNACAANISALKQLGVDIEIDDFGTGHASIVSLLKLSPSRFKIDRQLIAPIVERPQQRRLIKSIIDIGKSQDIRVCAEGVESRAHVEILRDLGCDCLQGFYFGRPMTADALADFVRNRTWPRLACFAEQGEAPRTPVRAQ